MDKYYFVVSHQLAERGEACRTGEACARWLTGQGETFDECKLSLAQVVDVQQLIRCQIARSIHYTTSAIIVRLPKQANSQAQSLLVVLVLLLQSIKVRTILVLGTGWRSVCTLIIILKCDKAIFNTFGSLRGFSDVIMEVDCMEHSPQFSLNSGSYPVSNRSAR